MRAGFWLSGAGDPVLSSFCRWTRYRAAGPGRIWLLGFACAWCLRRPEYVPAWSLAGLFLLADLLLQRPPGLWALLALMGCENLKSRAQSCAMPVSRGMADRGSIVIAITLANRVIWRWCWSTCPALDAEPFRTGHDPAILSADRLVTHGLMGVRKAAPGDLDALGNGYDRGHAMRRNRADNDASHAKLTRRAALLGGAQLLFMGGLAARMRYLQVDQADQFRLLAEENRINIRLIPPARGEIFDRNGVRLAENVPVYRIVMVREDAGDVESVMDRLASSSRLTRETRTALAEVKRSAPFLPVTIVDDVSWEDVSRVAVNAPALPGITPEVGLTRVYPRGADFAHVVGAWAVSARRTSTRWRTPIRYCASRVSRSARSTSKPGRKTLLRGKAGTKQVEVNATGRVMRELDRREGQSGPIFS